MSTPECTDSPTQKGEGRSTRTAARWNRTQKDDAPGAQRRAGMEG